MHVVITSPAVRPLTTGDNYYQHRIIASAPNSDHAVINISEPDALTHLEKMKAAGTILSYRPEFTDYQPMGLVYHGELTEQNVMGQQFEIVGWGPAMQLKADMGRGLRIGRGDTGLTAAAAQDAFQIKTEPASDAEAVDTHGHGTACSSIIGGMYGALPEAMIVEAAAIPNGQGSESTVANAIQRLVQAKVDMISLSLGGSASQIIDDMVVWAQRSGVPCSVAAGNGGPQDLVGSPARLALFVWGATSFDGRTSAPFSSGGNNWTLEVGALPGVDIGVAHLDGGYGRGSGTSFACPLGSAIAAALGRLL